MGEPKKIAVVLLNLGGPDKPADVRPFLFNLFSDPAIIAAPKPVRWALATLISTTRAPSARENYAKLGGGSPLLEETQKQADALEAALNAGADSEHRVFIAMRYWRPFTADAAGAVRDWGADETVLLPLYPQFSTSTTGSSLKAWRDAGGGPARIPCCYPEHPDFIAAHVRKIVETWEAAGRSAGVRVLFSAHGLPQRTIDRGDPYQWHVEQTVAAVARQLPPELADHRICYQSRVGPLKWIGPSTPEALEEAAADNVGVLVTPIAFVSEHIETLVELDDEYAELAKRLGIETYMRAPALGVDENFIAALSRLTRDALDGEPGLKPPCGARICPARHVACPVAPPGSV